MQDWPLQDNNHLHAFYKHMCLVKKNKNEQEEGNEEENINTQKLKQLCLKK